MADKGSKSRELFRSFLIVFLDEKEKPLHTFSWTYGEIGI